MRFGTIIAYKNNAIKICSFWTIDIMGFKGKMYGIVWKTNRAGTYNSQALQKMFWDIREPFNECIHRDIRDWCQAAFRILLKNQ